MPPRGTPTARQRRLGAELRKLRERAGQRSTDAAHQLGITQSRLSAIEGGRYGVSGERVRTLAHNYGCSDTALVDALVDMTRSRRRSWWDEYQGYLSSDLLDLSELEFHAHSVRTTQVTHLPGLLQTVDYARAVIETHIPKLPPYLLEYQVSHRIKRQQILWGEDARPYTATIHEAALRMEFGGRDVTRAQLRYLTEASEHTGITVRAIPFSAGTFPGAGQSAMYATGPVPQLDTVLLDTEHGAEQLHADVQLANYRTFFDSFEDMALEPAATRDLIKQIMESL